MLLAETSNNLRIALSGTFVFGPSEEDAIVQNWVLYLGALLWRTADAVFCLAHHRESIAAMIVQRQSVEYFVRLVYYDKYPKVAEVDWHRSIRQQIAAFEEDGMKGTPEHAAALAQRESLRAKYPDLSNDGPSVQQMMNDISGATWAYPRHYRYPSALLHGNALGASIIFKTDGATRTMIEELDLGHVHDILIDLARYMMQVGEIADRRLDRNNAAIWQQSSARLANIASRLSPTDPA